MLVNEARQYRDTLGDKTTPDNWEKFNGSSISPETLAMSFLHTTYLTMEVGLIQGRTPLQARVC